MRSTREYLIYSPLAALSLDNQLSLSALMLFISFLLFSICYSISVFCLYIFYFISIFLSLSIFSHFSVSLFFNSFPARHRITHELLSSVWFRCRHHKGIGPWTCSLCSVFFPLFDLDDLINFADDNFCVEWNMNLVT